MHLTNIFQTLSALSGIAIIVFWTLRLKKHLKRSICC